MSRSLPLLLAVILQPFICRAENVAGEVFIVTKASQNIRLGRVLVQAYDLQKTAELIAEKKEKAAPLLEKVSPLENQYHKANMAATERYLKAISDGSAAEILTSAYRDQQRIFSTWLQVQGATRFLRSGYYYFDGLKDPIAAVKTDSDGKYILAVQPGTYAVVAESKRTVGDSVERYHWMVKCEVKAGKQTDLTLSNDNQTSEESDESLIRTGPASVEVDGETGATILAKVLAMKEIASPTPAPVAAKMTVQEAQEKAVRVWPLLGVKDSPINKEFLSRVKLYRETKPELFNDPEWPYIIAKEADAATR